MIGLLMNSLSLGGLHPTIALAKTLSNAEVRE
jgi:hypothetical protein